MGVSAGGSTLAGYRLLRSIQAQPATPAANGGNP
jgi:hypothetical protein